MGRGKEYNNKYIFLIVIKKKIKKNRNSFQHVSI